MSNVKFLQSYLDAVSQQVDYCNEAQNLKVERERRLELEKQHKRQEEAEKLAKEKKIKHEKNMYIICSNIKESIGDMKALSEQKIEHFIEQLLSENEYNADFLPIIPNEEEKAQILENALVEKEKQIQEYEAQEKDKQPICDKKSCKNNCKTKINNLEDLYGLFNDKNIDK